MKRIVLALLSTVAIVAYAKPVQVSRSFDVDQISPTTFQIDCRIKWSGVDPSHTYSVAMELSATDMPSSYPYFTDNSSPLSPSNPKVSWKTSTGFTFTAELKPDGTLSVRHFGVQSSPTLTSYTWHTRHCQGGGMDYTTGERFPQFQITDQAQP